MSERTSASLRTAIPARSYRDISAPSLARDANMLRAVLLETGLAALTKRDESRLVLSPRRPAAAKRFSNCGDLHQNDYVEVGIVIRGAMTLWWEGAISTCSAGSVFVIPPDIRFLPHAAIPGRVLEPHSVVWLALHRGCAVAHLCSIEDDVHRLSEYYSFADSQITNIGRGIARELLERPEHFETAVRGGLICLLTTLLRAPVEKVARRDGLDGTRAGVPCDAFPDRVEAYLLSNYHLPLSLQQIAEAVGNSPTYVCRRYREITGQTPFQFLRDTRIMAAKRLLMSGTPISRVAEMVGFEDPQYFSKVFSSQAGESPQSFQKRHQTSGSESPNLADLLRNLADGRADDRRSALPSVQKSKGARVKLAAHPATWEIFAGSAIGTDTTIEFRNRTKTTVEIFWVGFDRTCKLYARIKPGQHLVQRTHVGHQWLVATEAGVPLCGYVAEANPGIAEIKPERASPACGERG